MNVNTHVIQRCSVLQSTLISYSYSDVHWSHEIQCVAACFAVCCCVAACFAVCCSSFGNHPKKKPPPPWGGSPTITLSTCMSTKGEASPFQGGYLPPGSPLGNHIKRKPPRGGVSYDQHACQQTHHPALNMHVNKHITQNGKDP